MRVGYNPNKDKILTKNKEQHQLIVPVHIPNNEGYFKDSLNVLKLSISSILKTSSNLFVTIVNNGSTQEVVSYLNQLLALGDINEVIHTPKIGKVNAIKKGIAGHDFDLVTITDADVLFLDNWQEETYKVFNNFNKAGVVGLVPQIKMFDNKCSNIIYDNFFSKQLKFENVQQPEDMRRFYESLGWKDNYRKIYLQKQLVLKSKKNTAIVGVGHFVATYKRFLFNEVLAINDNLAMGGYSEIRNFDEPVLKYDLYRLTTLNNLAYHIGNCIEPWMHNTYNALGDSPLITESIPKIKKASKKSIYYILKTKIFKRMFKMAFIKRWFLQRKGLSQNEASQF